MKYIGIIDKENKLITGEKLLTLQKNLKQTNNQIDELIRMRYLGFLNDKEYLRKKVKLLQKNNTWKKNLMREILI